MGNDGGPQVPVEKESARTQQRKAQVLKAAADCFRENGFHRSSMSKISARAGMSSGHIYHYFARKEDIVAGLVAQEEGELAAVVNAVKDRLAVTDVVSAIVEETSKTAERYLTAGNAGLTMEILAEAARNEEIAKQVARSDEDVRRSFYELFGSDSPEMASRCEIVAALLDGLQARVLRNPKVKDQFDVNILKNVLRGILTPC